jgi:hypothetical protein
MTRSGTSADWKTRHQFKQETESERKLRYFESSGKCDPEIEESLRDRMLNGQKTSFIRVRPCLDEGDRFERFGATFRIIKLESGILDEVCRRLWAQAGYASYNELHQVWLDLHKEYRPQGRVWVHYFERV